MIDHPQTYEEALELSLAWATGQKSHWNAVLEAEADCETRQRSLARCAEMDAVEATKWATIAQAMAARPAEAMVDKASIIRTLEIAQLKQGGELRAVVRDLIYRLENS